MYGTQLDPGGVADIGLWYGKPNSQAWLLSHRPWKPAEPASPKSAV